MRRILFLLSLLSIPVVTGLSAQARPTAPSADPRPRTVVAPGWHPYVAVAPAFPLGRLGELAGNGIFGKVGGWYIPREVGVGVAVDLVGAVLPIDTDEPIDGRYTIIGGTVSVTSKAKRRVFFEWLGGYGIAGAGYYRHGGDAAATRTNSAGVNVGLGLLTPVFGREGFVEARFHHLFSGKTLGDGSGITLAPLVVGLRF